MQEGIVEVTQFIPHECIADVFPVPQFRNNFWEAKCLPQERVSSIAEQVVVCFRHRSC